MQTQIAVLAAAVAILRAPAGTSILRLTPVGATAALGA
jgi:hypothetical protein